ncbi:hypothetical protein VIGAN_11022200, partial [Vigna angularis var. angularis]
MPDVYSLLYWKTRTREELRSLFIVFLLAFSLHGIAFSVSSVFLGGVFDHFWPTFLGVHSSISLHCFFNLL